MKLVELFEDTSIYDEQDDNREYTITDVRKPKLRLSDLQKLRKYREFKQEQDAKRDAIVSTVYAPPPEAPQGGLGGL